MGASSPARPYLYGGLFLFLLVTIFLICAAAVPRFGDVKVAVSSDQVSGSASFTLGAFQVCLDVFIINVCVPISSSCELSSSGVGGQALNLPTLPYCGTYNAFRGFLITSLVLAGLALVAALAHTFMASPSPNIGHFTFVSALLSAVTAAISLVCWASWASAASAYQGLDPFGTQSDPSTSVTFTYANGPSFYLLISALVGIIVAVIVWLYGRVQQRASSGMGGEPHYLTAPAQYASDVQLHQPLTQH